jgi:hypothetical protein
VSEKESFRYIFWTVTTALVIFTFFIYKRLSFKKLKPKTTELITAPHYVFDYENLEFENSCDDELPFHEAGQIPVPKRQIIDEDFGLDHEFLDEKCPLCDEYKTHRETLIRLNLKGNKEACINFYKKHMQIELDAQEEAKDMILNYLEKSGPLNQNYLGIAIARYGCFASAYVMYRENAITILLDALIWEGQIEKVWIGNSIYYDII